jgi:Transposase DDE domain group 1
LARVVAKGAANRRAELLAKQVKRWDVYHATWIGEVVSPIDFGRPVQVFVKKRVKNGGFVHRYYVSTLKLPSKGRLMSDYDARRRAVVEQFRNHKGGLQLEARRKRSFVAQKTLILLTDLAHNLLADFQRHPLTDSKFAAFGLKRIVRHLFQLPGRLVFDGTHLKRIDLLASHPHAKDLLICLEKYCSLD